MVDRIVIDPEICHGKPVVRGTRTPVTVILDAIAGGDSFELIQNEYRIGADDIRDCIAFASAEINQRRFHPGDGRMMPCIFSLMQACLHPRSTSSFGKNHAATDVRGHWHGFRKG